MTYLREQTRRERHRNDSGRLSALKNILEKETHSSSVCVCVCVCACVCVCGGVGRGMRLKRGVESWERDREREMSVRMIAPENGVSGYRADLIRGCCRHTGRADFSGAVCLSVFHRTPCRHLLTSTM